MNMKKNIIKFLSILLLILGSVIVSLGQPLPPNSLGPDNVLPGQGSPYLNCFACVCPIENGCWILLALASSYGVYKIWQMRKEKTGLKGCSPSP